MTTETGSPRSRRALLAASLGAGVAAVASALGRPSPTRAANGGSIILGAYPSVLNGTGVNEATASTEIFTTMGTGLFARSSSTTGLGLYGYASAVTGATYGVEGQSNSTGGTGVYGYAYASTGDTSGVYGKSDSATGIGVRGFATSGSGATNGVVGSADSPSGRGVLGVASNVTGATTGIYGRVWSPDGTGVLGYSGIDVDPAPVAKTGVYGYAAQDSGSRGVYGRSTAGRGVYGQATTGQGVRGQATTGAALFGATTDLKKGFAVRALGRVKFDQSAGIATILSGTNSIVVTPGIDLVSTSAVTATLQGNPVGSVTVKSVAVNATNDTFTIYLTANATANVKVAWHVFG